MDIKNLSGFEMIQAMMDGKIPAPTMSQTIPMRPTLIESGEITFEVQADQHHLDPLGNVHVGFAATVLDTVTGCAIHTLLEAGARYGTADLNIKMCRPIPQNKPLNAIGKVINLGEKLGISEGQIIDENGELYAYATAACVITR
ncbi:phenylacetic acid degradation protein [Acinetobacter sp. SFD]|uniref:PaaI family thioesterase n=1 Tax=Acinetobacter sp. SFD TaxID=1805635 RepID=UPI0007D04BFA|nr:PaaI family thioesterase [Acinetobacter sp. SFD]OAL83730.1 phenylacetic acid degradation protein [Acinetobacter sp. SFD]